LGVGSQLAVSQPLWSDLLRWGVAGGVAVLFFGSVLLHELAHALVARRHGMGGGSVTLLFFGGGVTQGQEPHRPADEALVAAAGPIASGLLTGAFLGAWFVSEFIPDALGEAASQVALALAALNALLALLNLLPVYPLDGGRILRAVLWGVSHDQRRAARGVALTSRIGGWGLIGAGAFVWLGGDALDGLMLAVCGWFVSGTARGVERRLAIEDLVAGMRVENAMERDLPAVAPQLTLDTFAAQYLATGEGTSLPVMRNETLLGLIGISQLRRIRRTAWPTMRAADVMVSPPTLPTLAPEDELWSGLDRLRRAGLDGLPVLRGEQLLGVLTRRSIVNAIAARSRPLAGASPVSGAGT